MKNKSIFSGLILGMVLLTAACSGNGGANKAHNQPAAHEDHSGHDHGQEGENLFAEYKYVCSHFAACGQSQEPGNCACGAAFVENPHYIAPEGEAREASTL